jgi:hypothetical protein
MHSISRGGRDFSLAATRRRSVKGNSKWYFIRAYRSTIPDFQITPSANAKLNPEGQNFHYG